MAMFHRTDNLDDKGAMDWIAQILRQEEIDNEDWALIMKVVQWSGRSTDIEEIEDNDE